jgi:preprotein translocase subunit SecY
VVLLRNFINIFYVPELRKKLFFTLVVLVIYRLGNHIPIIGIDIDQLHDLVVKKTMLGGLFSYLDLFSGGSMSKGMLFALGISPYITASIMMQFLTLSIPYLEMLSKEGEFGRKLINQYTRYLALGVSLIQSFTLVMVLEKSGLVIDPGWGARLIFIFSLTIGSMFVMWLGEQISLHGLGNGSSMIIFAGIVSRLPDDVIKTIGAVQQGMIDPLVALIIFLVIVGITACIVFLEKGQRKIAVQYARRIVGQRMYGGQSSYIPFKINSAGVMPVIFANTMLNVPLFIISAIAARFESMQWLSGVFSQSGLLYNTLNFVLIIAFTFVYTAIQYNPDELAENMKKSGGFIPGIRPGKKTAEFFNFLLTRLGLVGALYLGMLVVIPTIVHLLLKMPFYVGVMSGTALLIMVGVALDTAAQVEAYLIEHNYEGFLLSGRMTGRKPR